MTVTAKRSMELQGASGSALVSDYLWFSNGYGYVPGTNRISEINGYGSPYSGLYPGWLYDAPIVRAFSYEPRRDLIAAVSNSWDGALVSAFDYVNDAAGRRTRRVDTTPALPVTNVFGYNPRSEVTEAVMGDDTYGYAYDPIGNRVWSAENAATNVYASNPLNQYTNISGGAASSTTYDADGNMTFCALPTGEWRLFWDGENRLVLASNATTLVRNTYDPRSRRIRKEVSAWDEQVAAYVPQSASHYLWDGRNVFREVRDQMSEVSTNYYKWGNDLSGSLQGAGGVGGLLAVTTVSAANPQPVIYFPLFDANGNVTEYVSTNGTVAARYAYDAFGSTTAQSGPLADAFTHRFSTKPFDAETGLVMYQLRPYEPGLGRWLGRDPIEEEGGVSLYGFVGNDPTDRLDLLGLFDKNSYTLVKSWMTFDQTMCPEFHGNGGTIEEYKKMFSNDGVTGRLKMLTVPVSLRVNLANSMAIALNMKTKYYYELTMKLNYWKNNKCKKVDKNICASGKQTITYHVIEMESPSAAKPGYVKQYNDKEGKTGLRDVTPSLPIWVGPVSTCKCVL